MASVRPRAQARLEEKRQNSFLSYEEAVVVESPVASFVPLVQDGAPAAVVAAPEGPDACGGASSSAGSEAIAGKGNSNKGKGEAAAKPETTTGSKTAGKAQKGS